MSLRAALKSLFNTSSRQIHETIDVYQDDTRWSALSQEQKNGMLSISGIMVCLAALLLFAVYDLLRTVIPNVALITLLILLGQWVSKKYNVPFYISIRE